MTDEEIFTKIRAIIIDAKADTVLIRPEEISPDSELSQVPLAMDSIDFVRMIIGIEQTFAVIAEDEDFLAASMRTVGDVVAVVNRRLGVTGSR